MRKLSSILRSGLGPQAVPLSRFHPARICLTRLAEPAIPLPRLSLSAILAGSPQPDIGAAAPNRFRAITRRNEAPPAMNNNHMHQDKRIEARDAPPKNDDWIVIIGVGEFIGSNRGMVTRHE